TTTYQNVTCYGYDTVTVDVKSRPVIVFPTFPKKCVDGVPINLLCTVKYNGSTVAPTSIYWQCPSLPSAIINAGQFDPLAAAALGGTFVIYATVEYNGCSSTDSTTVQINPLPIVSAGGDKVFCENVGSVLLDTMASPFNVKYGVWSILTPGTPSGA